MAIEQHDGGDSKRKPVPPGSNKDSQQQQQQQQTAMVPAGCIPLHTLGDSSVGLPPLPHAHRATSERPIGRGMYVGGDGRELRWQWLSGERTQPNAHNKKRIVHLSPGLFRSGGDGSTTPPVHWLPFAPVCLNRCEHAEGPGAFVAKAPKPQSPKAPIQSV